MKKLNETSVTMDISGLKTDAANAKSIIDAINAGEVADAPVDPEMPEELDFNTDLVPDEFADDSIGVEDDVVPEMDEDDKLLLEDDPVEDSETIIADLINDGATTTTDIDGAIRECCELIGESVDNIDFGKIHQLIEGKEKAETLDEDTIKQGSSWVNKGKEGTHGKFKTKKEADAQRKAMFASGYKAESANEISDFDALCEAAMKGEVVGKFYDGDNEVDYEITQRDGAFYIDSDTVFNRDGMDGPFTSYAEAEHELQSTYPNLTEMPIEDADLGVRFTDAKEAEFVDDNDLFEAAMREGDFDKSYEEIYDLLINGNLDEYRAEIQRLGRYGIKGYLEWASEAGINEGDLRLDLAVPENSSYEETDEDFENLFSQLVNGNLDIYRQKLLALGRDGVKAYVAWASDNGIPVEELKLQMGLNETSNPDCNYGTSPNPYLKDCKKTPCKMARVKGFAARSKEQEGFPLRKDDGLSPKITAIKESAENMLASARSDAHKKAIIRRMADKMVAEGVAYSDAFEILSNK